MAAEVEKVVELFDALYKYKVIGEQVYAEFDAK